MVVVAENLNRLVTSDSELTRKIVHIGSGNVILLAWWLNIPATVIIGASIIAGLVALTSYIVPILPSINSVGRKSWGTFFYAVSIGVLIAYFWYPGQRHYAVIGILIMAWGDGLAAIIGQQWGKHGYEILGTKKSWEGSLAMMLASFVVVSATMLVVSGISWNIWMIALTVAVAATFLEAFSKLGIDNLTVPLGSAALSLFLGQIL